MMGPHYGWGWGTMIIGSILMLLFWAALIAFIVWIVRALTKPSGTTSSSPSPLDIAKGRYARGEITKGQVEQPKKDLS